MKRPDWKLVWLVLAFLGLPVAASADDSYTFPVPAHAWSVAFAMPSLVKYQAQSGDGQFQFEGQTDGGITVSFFVEPVPGATSESCRQQYWRDASRNPMIASSSVKLTDVSGKPGVLYVMETDYQGQHIRMQNVNVYLAIDGTCIDLHISKIPFAAGDDTRLATIAGTLTTKAN